MNFTMDLTTSVTILSGLATFLGFVWSIFHSYQKKKDESDSEDDECQDKEESIEKLGNRVEELEKTVGSYAVELEKLTELAAIAKEENARIRQDFLDNLDRIENRLEKMIDLILRLKQED